MGRNLVRLGVGVAAAIAPLGLLAAPAHADTGCIYIDQQGNEIHLNDGDTVVERDGDSTHGYAWVCQEGTLIFAGYEAM